MVIKISCNGTELSSIEDENLWNFCWVLSHRDGRTCIFLILRHHFKTGKEAKLESIGKEQIANNKHQLEETDSHWDFSSDCVYLWFLPHIQNFARN